MNFSDLSYRRNLSKRIVEYGGSLTLTIKKTPNLIVIISDNILEMKENVVFKQHQDQPQNQGQKDQPLHYNSSIAHNKDNLTRSKMLRNINNSMLSRSTLERKMYKEFMSTEISKEKQEANEILLKLDQILSMGIPIIKITEFHQILDYFDSFSKFDWHTRRDDWRLLRSWINEHGCFIVTSKRKLYMKLRHRMEFHRFSTLNCGK